MNNKKTAIHSLLLFMFFCVCNAQNSQYTTADASKLIFEGTTIENAIAFEESLQSTLEKPFAKIFLSPQLYPHVDDHKIAQPKTFIRNRAKHIPVRVEYFYDKNSRKVKFASYRWSFDFKVSDDDLFNRKKLTQMVQKECKELKAYSTLFAQLDKNISAKFEASEKNVIQNEERNKKITWKNNAKTAVLEMEFQDCTDTNDLLPGYFVITLTAYSK